MIQQDEQKLRAGRGTFNFKGCLITQIVGGWQVFSTNYSSPEQVIEAIDNAGKSIKESIGGLTVTVSGDSFGVHNDKNLEK